MCPARCKQDASGPIARDVNSTKRRSSPPVQPLRCAHLFNNTSRSKLRVFGTRNYWVPIKDLMLEFVRISGALPADFPGSARLQAQLIRQIASNDPVDHFTVKLWLAA